jgi:hypothetical protein
MTFSLPFGTHQVVRARDIVTEAEAEALLTWATKMKKMGKLVSNPRDRTTFQTPYVSARTRGLTTLTENSQDRDDIIWVPENDRFDPTNIPETFWTVRDRAVQAIGLKHLTEDPYKGNFLGLIGPGEGVHQHKDARVVLDGEESLLVRCNVLFRRPAKGGLPVIAGQVLDVPDRGMWAFFASEQVHSATPVEGSILRGLMSFGIVIERKQVDAAGYQFTPNFRDFLHLQGDDWVANFLNALVKSETSPETVKIARHILDGPSTFTLGTVAGATGLPVWDALTAIQKLEVSGMTEPVKPPETPHEIVTL